MGDPLEVYRRKRDFTRTPEPAGAAPSADGGARFVVQRHRASRLHYDLRFEIDGVLVSWAVPKGPTLDPSVRRLAMHVEDHPIEYLTFEGVIPSREYGGGDVVVWDTGTWEPVKTDDPRAAVESGELHAEVYGDKLRGRFVLVRRGGDQGDDAWMLLHKRDPYAVDGWDPEDHPRSVLSGRTNEEVKADPHFLWRSDEPAARARVSLLPEPVAEEAIDALDALGARGTWKVFGRTVTVTGLDEEVLPGDPPVTRRELLAYAARIAPVTLPYVEGRALTLHRPEQRPTHPSVDEPAALVRAVGHGAVEWRASLVRDDAPRTPTYAVVDLDQGARRAWDDQLTLARLYRTALDHLGVTGRPLVDGHGGLQVWIPVAGARAAAIRTWAEALADTVAQVVPDLAGDAPPEQPATYLVPYSPRLAPGAPVVVPLAWDELDDPALRPDGWTIRTVLDRLETVGDPFRALLGSAQALPDLH